MGEKKNLYKQKIELKEVIVENEIPYASIDCPSCKEQVSADNLDLGKGVAKCSGCHIIFPIEEAIQAITTSNQDPKQEVLQPEGIEIFEYRNELELVVNQYTTGWDITRMIVIPFFFFMTLGIYAEGAASSWLPISAAILSLWTFWIGFNRKRKKIFININQETIDIQWRPKGLKKDKSFARDSIEQSYVKEDGLFMILDDFGEKRHIQLFSQLLNKAKAHYIERTIENHLGIKDVKYGN